MSTRDIRDLREAWAQVDYLLDWLSDATTSAETGDWHPPHLRQRLNNIGSRIARLCEAAQPVGRRKNLRKAS
jgi:hypothetical protein